VRVVAALVASPAVGGRFLRRGTDPASHNAQDCPRGHGVDLGAALWRLEESPVAAIWEGWGDPFWKGVASFLVGCAPKYVEDCAVAYLAADAVEDGAHLNLLARVHGNQQPG
jgi:hypothetical protein